MGGLVSLVMRKTINMRNKDVCTLKLLRSPIIDSKEPISPRCVAWWAGTTTLFLSIPSPHRLFKNSSTVHCTVPTPSRLTRIYLHHWRDAGWAFLSSNKSCIYRQGVPDTFVLKCSPPSGTCPANSCPWTPETTTTFKAVFSPSQNLTNFKHSNFCCLNHRMKAANTLHYPSPPPTGLGPI